MCLDISMRELLCHNAQAQSDAHHVCRRFRFLVCLSFSPSISPSLSSFFPSSFLSSFILSVFIYHVIPIRAGVSRDIVAFRVFFFEKKDVQKATPYALYLTLPIFWTYVFGNEL